MSSLLMHYYSSLARNKGLYIASAHFAYKLPDIFIIPTYATELYGNYEYKSVPAPVDIIEVTDTHTHIYLRSHLANNHVFSMGKETKHPRECENYMQILCSLVHDHGNARKHCSPLH